MTAEKPRVVLVEDDRDVRESLGFLLNGSPAIELVGTFPAAEPALAAIERGLAVDVAILDLGLPQMSGQGLIRRLREIRPSLDMLVLTIFDDRENVFDALRSGAAGYLLKGTPVQQIIDGVLQVARGGSSMSPTIARRVIADLWAKPTATAPLTAREVEVLQLLVKGATYDLIGQSLGIATGTVQTHIKAIYRKLEVCTKAEAAAEAFRRGFVS